MCTPRFMCKFPFSGRVSLSRADSSPTLAARPERAPKRAEPMRNRVHRRRSAVARLRLAIDCLPVATREAMLDGVRSSDRVIAGAYVDRDGGVCPMLAAHRRGSRIDFLSFAKSWDRFASATGGPRAATRRQVAILVNLLEASLLSSSTGLELDR